MRIYISAGSTELERAKAFAVQCQEAGHTITHPWWHDVERHLRGEKVSMAGAASSDIHGVCICDVLVALIPEKPSKGLWYELGYAAAINAPALIVGPAGCADIWETRHDRVDDEDAALAWVEGIVPYAVLCRTEAV